MKIVKGHLRLFVSITICIIVGLLLILIKYNDKKILPDVYVYNVHRFYIGCCELFDDISSYENNKTASGLKSFLFPAEKSIKFKYKNMVFECVNTGRGVSITDRAYYVA